MGRHNGERDTGGGERHNTERGNDGVLMGIRNMGGRYLWWWWGGGIMGREVLVGRQWGERYWWGDITGREVLGGRHKMERGTGGET